MSRIIPAIDLIDGKCVRLTQGDYNKKKSYHENPLDVALKFQDFGIKYLHLVDLDGAREKRVINYNILEAIASKTNLQVDFGGGVQSDADLKIVFECGAKQVTGGSIAIKNAELFKSWFKQNGREKIILGTDVKDKKIAIHGWQETSDIWLFDLINDYMESGLKYTICTDVAKDGMMEGPSFDLYKEILDKFPDLKVIASGGVTTMKDVEKLQEIKVDGIIIGKAIYEETIKLADLQTFMGS
ncbi:MAG: 1-(5-phosphoribosyl)-5-[(5-phosphoribosylamino)methylideneamino]imidazole-4-carboxamide isomerase [Opitutaceae bacterium]|nr:1-(5-phosphoribosyl)-5-[(5-phosphoribosylamino)methylideneamino]imidazole-4-carboxamide isomerase [Cytophagales bacterium]